MSTAEKTAKSKEIATRQRVRWWRLVARTLGAGLLVAAITTAVLQVYVSGADGTSRSCGSSFDVIAGRSDWQTWRTQDLADAQGLATATPAGLVRTARCPSAVNDRTALAGGLAIGSAMLLSAGAYPRRRGGIRAWHGVNRLQWLGNFAVVVGALLTTGGLVGLLIVLANPRSTLFLYVSRPAALLIGLAVLQPALALLIAGLAISAVARSKDGHR